MRCGNHKIYHTHSNKASQSFPSGCSTIQLPVQEHSHKDELIITAEFELEVHVSNACSSCYSRGGLCKLIGNKGKFHCNITEKDIDIGITQKATSFAGTGVLIVIIYCSWRKLSSIKSINFWKKENVPLN
ncbi:hypothetical protein CFP56_002216 [Quercus suber]|uniref:Wall-associated receptor kinase C-terminal domain-containing protein n=1 Tax=Quercus suber TaxID=58331 RepID=A0AAW0M8R3_QUESU